MNYKTTKQDFLEFEKEAWYWINYFGLKQWEWDFRHEQLQDARASYNVEYMAKYVYIRMGTVFNNKPVKNELKICAFHEICHILLTNISRLATASCSEKEITTREHEIIQTLTNTLFQDNLRRRHGKN